jgi:tetratricopeptide (TPR) repeat protein
MAACPDERVMLDLVAGRIPASETAIREHLDTCATCQDLVVALSSNLEGAVSAAPAIGGTIGRYVIRREIGRGAMATVYAAHDPELDREVALKLVHFRDGGTSAERLIREARAMAKLAHPNVTRIYDVGTEGDNVFLAMELVAGVDLARLLVKERLWQDMRKVFAGAAEGLAAAHAQHLIHRDFKPSNVLVGADGRVLVTDFGLVHNPNDTDAELAPADGADRTEVLSLTRTGTIVGTPAYMAPELLAGDAAADELTDQFSFAVSLFEALHGIRPFAGDDLATLRDNVLAGKIRDVTGRRAVPRWLHRIAIRGLGPRDRRYPSMADVAKALRADASRITRPVLAVAGIVTALGTAAIFAQSRRSTAAAPDPCAAGEAKIAAIWSPMRSATLGVGFSATGVAYAPDAWRSTAARLDRFEREWTAGYRDACQASRAGVQSGELLDRRMQCLDARKDELSQLVTMLSAPNASIIGRAPQAADALSQVADCANTLALGTLVPPPAGVAPAEIERVRSRIAHLNMLRNSTAPTGVLEEATAVVTDAKKLGYAPLLAEAYVAAAIVHMVANDVKQATADIDDAVVAAEAGRHFRAKAHALAVGMELAYNLGDLEGAVAKDRLARAALSAIGGDGKLEADLESVLGWIADGKNDGKAAEAHLRRALELRQKVLGEQDLATARAHENLGSTLGNSGDLAAALAESEKGLAIERAQIGDKHPAIGQTLANIAEIESQLGKHEQAIRHSQQALAVIEASMPESHPATAFATLQLGAVYHQAHDFAHAVVYMRKAVARYEKAVGPDHPELGRALTNLAATLSELGKHDEVVDVARRALAIQEKAMGADSPGTATIRATLGAGLVATGKVAEGLAQLDTALALREKAWGKTDPRVAKSQFELAKILRTHGDKRRANDLANRALETYRIKDRATEAIEVQRWIESR